MGLIELAIGGVIGSVIGFILGRRRGRRRALSPRALHLKAAAPSPAWDFPDAVRRGEVGIAGRCTRCDAAGAITGAGELLPPPCGGGAICRGYRRPPPPPAIAGPGARVRR